MGYSHFTTFIEFLGIHQTGLKAYLYKILEKYTMSHIPTILVSAIDFKINSADKMVVISLIDKLSSNEKNQEYNFALPASVISQLSYELNKICEILELDSDIKDE